MPINFAREPAWRFCLRFFPPFLAILFVVLVLGVAWGCSSGCFGLDPPKPEIPLPLRVEYAGCAEVFDNRICAVSSENKTLKVWVETEPSADIRIDAGHGAKISSPTVVEGGQRFEVTLGDEVDSLVVTAKNGKNQSNQKRLLLQHIAIQPVLETIEKARLSGDLQQAKSLLEKNLSALGDDATSLEARMALSAGEMPQAISLFKESILRYRSKGRTLSAVYDACRLVYLLIINQSDFVAAEEWIRFCEFADRSFVELAHRITYFRSLVALVVGRYRDALADISEAEAIVRRFDFSDRFLGILLHRTSILQQLGRLEEAKRVLDQIDDFFEKQPHSTPCQQSLVLENRAWLILLKLEAGESDATDPISLLLQARHIGETALNCEWNSRVNIILNLALAYIHKGQIGEADKELQRLENDKTALSLFYRVWQLDLEARIASMKGKHEAALMLFSELYQLGEAAMLLEVKWRATVGMAEVYIATNKTQRAIELLQESHNQASEAILRVPLGEGRAAFVAQRRRALTLYMELLLQKREIKEALWVARRARSSVLQSIITAARSPRLSSGTSEGHHVKVAKYVQQRDALRRKMKDLWQVPADKVTLVSQQHEAERATLRRLMDEAFSSEQNVVDNLWARPLPTPPESSLWLFYFDLGAKWIGFAMDSTQVEAITLPPVSIDSSQEVMSALLLDRFQTFIERNRRIEVVLPDGFQDIDFHTLPWPGGMLMHRKEVAYKLDVFEQETVDKKEHESTHSSNAPVGLIVLDPRADLSGARSENEFIEKFVRHSNFQILKGMSANATAFEKAVSGADFLYYAGHGTHTGAGGLESALLLSGQDTFEVGEILALRRVPQTVFLMGCETGMTGQDSEGWGVGLAQAFLIAGSETVVGAVRPISDATARGFAHALWGTSPDAAHLSQNIFQTMTRFQESEERGDLGAIRVFSR